MIDRSEAVVVLLAVMVLFFSLTLTAQSDTVYAPLQNQFDTLQQFALSVPLVVGISADSGSELNQSSRVEIYCLVQNSAGIHFRGICDALCLSVGMVQYHVGILVGAGFLSVYCDGKMKRYFETGKYSPREMKTISLLRHKTRGRILRLIVDEKVVGHGEFVRKLSITSQGVSWQMHRLEKEGLVEEASNGLKLTYFINDAYVALVADLVKAIE
jgi:predicted transcriptional regulator